MKERGFRAADWGQAILFGLACATYFLLFIVKLPAEMMGWLKSAALSVVFSSEAKYNEASGFRLFWFLPALWSLSYPAGLNGGSRDGAGHDRPYASSDVMGK